MGGKYREPMPCNESPGDLAKMQKLILEVRVEPEILHL